MAWSRMQLSLLLVYFYIGSYSSKTVIGKYELQQQQPEHIFIIDKFELGLSLTQHKRYLKDVVKTFKNGTHFRVITLNGTETKRFDFMKNVADESWIGEINKPLVKPSKVHGVIVAFSDLFDKQIMSGTGITTLLVNDKTEIEAGDKEKMDMKNQKVQVVLYGRHTHRWTELTGNSGCVQILGDNVEDVENAVKSMTESCTDHFNPTQKTVPTDFVSYSTFIIFTVVQFVLHFVLLVVAACVIYVCKDIKEKRYSTGSKEENEILLKEKASEENENLKTIIEKLCTKVEPLVKTEDQEIKKASEENENLKTIIEKLCTKVETLVKTEDQEIKLKEERKVAEEWLKWRVEIQNAISKIEKVQKENRWSVQSIQAQNEYLQSEIGPGSMDQDQGSKTFGSDIYLGVSDMPSLPQPSNNNRN